MVAEVVVVVAAATSLLYRFSRHPPPHIWLLLPSQAVLHSDSATLFVPSLSVGPYLMISY